MKKLVHAYTKEIIPKIFNYDGIYYPAIGSKYTGWNSRRTKTAYNKKLGGWGGFWHFLPEIAIKCKLKDPKRPYKQHVIDMITNHDEMILSKFFYSDDNNDNYMWVVKTPKGEYIGDIDSALSILFLKELGTHGEESDTICFGYNEENGMACGYSHRARQCFQMGDKIFISKFGDDNTLFREHGIDNIMTHADLMESAKSFANYVA